MPTFMTMTGPGTGEIVDDAAAAILAQTVALTADIAAATLAIKGVPTSPSPNAGTLVAIESQLYEINYNIARIADASKPISDQMKKLKSESLKIFSDLNFLN